MSYPNITPSSSAVVPFPGNFPGTATSPGRDREAAHFLRLLDADDAKGFTFQTFHDRPKEVEADPSLARVTSDRDEVVHLYGRGAGVYVTINETDLTGRRSENIKRVRAVWQQDDGGHGGPLPLDPSLVVESSPGKFHRYWLVADHWPADDQGRADFAAVMERMVESYGSDKNAKDITRVLRLPGFLHRKDPLRPHMVRIIEAGGRRYTREEIMRAFPPVEREKPREREFQPGDCDEMRIADALRCIPADDRDIWLQVGMALKDELGDRGRPLWDAWSATCADKFKDRHQERTWRSFRRNGITIATLFHYAKLHGWAPPRREDAKKNNTTPGNGPTSSSTKSGQVAALAKADQLKPESIDWAWKNRFAFGKLAVIAGDPGLGKSTLLIEIAALHSVGGEFPCREGRAQQCESLILTAEDGLRDTLVPRLMAAGADLSKIRFLLGVKTEAADDETLFDLSRDIAVLRKVLIENPNIKILIIDPLTAYLGATKAKENSEVRRVLAPLVRLIEETGVLCIANNHLNKGQGKAIYRVLDSVAFVAVVRIVHLIIQDSDNRDNRKLICDKDQHRIKAAGPDLHHPEGLG
jgi:hypothetical protein